MNSHRLMQTLVAVLMFATLPSLAEPQHIISKPRPVVSEAMTLARLQRLLDARNAELRKLLAGSKSQVERHIIRDLSWPKDQAEFESVRGSALLMLLATTRDSSELPLKGAYVATDEGEPIFLFHIATLPEARLRQLKVGAAAGSHAWAGLFLVPRILQLKGPVLAAFRAHRYDFAIGLELPRLPPGSPLKDPSDEAPLDSQALKAMVAREYPDFVMIDLPAKPAAAKP